MRTGAYNGGRGAKIGMMAFQDALRVASQTKATTVAAGRNLIWRASLVCGKSATICDTSGLRPRGSSRHGHIELGGDLIDMADSLCQQCELDLTWNEIAAAVARVPIPSQS